MFIFDIRFGYFTYNASAENGIFIRFIGKSAKSCPVFRKAIFHCGRPPEDLSTSLQTWSTTVPDSYRPLLQSESANHIVA